MQVVPVRGLRETAENHVIALTCLLLVGPLTAQNPDDFPADLRSRALAATVRVHCPAKNSAGSGAVVGRTGGFAYVLTAEHIVGDSEGVEITSFSEKGGPQTYRECRIVARSGDLRDLVLIRVQTDANADLRVLSICPSGEMPKAEDIGGLALGCSEGREPSSTAYSALNKKSVRQKGAAGSAYFWESAGTIAKGRSGGPIIDKRGLIVGVCSCTSEGKGYYTHIHEIARFLKQNRFDWLAEEKQGGKE
jgi:S1-C subfamily serine protease